MKVIKKKLLFSFLITACFYLMAHGYRMFNNMFSGDALINIYQDDYAWQIALGRCFNPVWVFIRGTIISPWFLALLAIVWISLSVYLITDIFEIDGYLPIVLISAVLCMNSVLTCLSASFLPWLDIQIFALFLNVFGVWLLQKGKPLTYIFGTISLVVGLGTYQAYIMISVSLVIMIMLRKVLNKEKLSEIFKQLGFFVLCVGLAGAVYFGSWKLIQNSLNIWTANSYNGLADLGDYADTSFFGLIVGAYKRFFLFFWNQDTFVSLFFRGISLSIIWKAILRIANILTICTIAFGLIAKCIKNKLGLTRSVLIAIAIVLFPLGSNFVYVISKGMEHTLMIYSFVFVYVLAVVLAFEKTTDLKKEIILRGLVIVLLAIICWSNTIFSNQIYVKKALQEETAISLLTRVVEDIEDTEGYKAGETKVALVGTFAGNPYIKEPEGFEELVIYHMGNTPFIYEGTETAFLKYCMSSNIEFVEVDRNGEEVSLMPVYPEEGSIEYLDDVLVVKISN